MSIFPRAHRDVTPFEASPTPGFCCMSILNDSNTPELWLGENHNYYAQVQGQMAVGQRTWCGFVIFTNKGNLSHFLITVWEPRLLVQFPCTRPSIHYVTFQNCRTCNDNHPIKFCTSKSALSALYSSSLRPFLIGCILHLSRLAGEADRFPRCNWGEFIGSPSQKCLEHTLLWGLN